MKSLLEKIEKESKEKFVNDYNLAGSSGYCNPRMAQKIADWWIVELRFSNLAVIEEVVKMCDEMNNFRNAKVDGKEDWNDALEQSANKVDAFKSTLLKSLEI